jgi:N-acetylglucosaminyldiphosphoundecaprenol N-acetyl-beta-D-mannosaminyltransferase
VLTLYINPSSYFRIVSSGIVIPKHAQVHIDSTLLHKISRFIRSDFHRRCFDLSHHIGDANPLLSAAQQHEDWRLLFIGGTPEEARSFTEVMNGRYHLGARLKACTGFAEDMGAHVDEQIASYQPTHLIFGLGAPVQERLAIQYEAMHPSLDVRTCGGFITQTSLNGGDFYPGWVQSLGVRWLYRFYKQPNVIKRTMVEYPRGIFYFVASCLRGRLA